MQSNFDEAFGILLGLEGKGWSEYDPGGETHYGIRRDLWEHEFGVWPPKPKQIKDFYYDEFWDALRCSDYPQDLALQLFLTGVNVGTTRARRLLQQAIASVSRQNLKLDGVIGPKTRRAFYFCDPVRVEAAFTALADQYYRSLAQSEEYRPFLDGWLKRLYGERA